LEGRAFGGRDIEDVWDVVANGGEFGEGVFGGGAEDAEDGKGGGGVPLFVEWVELLYGLGKLDTHWLAAGHVVEEVVVVLFLVVVEEDVVAFFAWEEEAEDVCPVQFSG
jgi:hypothetical protein